MLLFHVWLYSSPDGAPVSFGELTRVLPDLAFGVTLFFTLSGYLLYRPFAAALIRSTDRPSFGAYLRNRALRILPAYVVIVVLSSVVLRSVFVRDESGELVVEGAPSPQWLLTNLALAQNYVPTGVITGIAPAWSLAVEVVFYISLPVLVLCGMLIASRTTTPAGRIRSALVPAALVLAIGLIGKATSTVVGSGADDGWGADWNSVLERSAFCHFDLFAFGMALAVVHVWVEDSGRRPSRGARLTIATGGVGTYVLTTTAMAGWDQLTNSPLNTTMALSCALVLALVVLPTTGSRPAAIVRVLETRPLVLIGLVSYSVFLWHLPVILALNEHGLTIAGRFGFFVNAIVVGGVTLLLSLLTYRFVEEPALRRKRSVTGRTRDNGKLGEPLASSETG